VTISSALQIGSYFGAALCSVDVNRDGDTDLILIGAPHYYEQTRGGQVSVCSMPRVSGSWDLGWLGVGVGWKGLGWAWHWFCSAVEQVAV
jgi:hypothetical protein